jgi:hypothetical protein
LFFGSSPEFLCRSGIMKKSVLVARLKTVGLENRKKREVNAYDPWCIMLQQPSMFRR